MLLYSLNIFITKFRKFGTEHAQKVFWTDCSCFPKRKKAKYQIQITTLFKNLDQ